MTVHFSLAAEATAAKLGWFVTLSSSSSNPFQLRSHAADDCPPIQSAANLTCLNKTKREKHFMAGDKIFAENLMTELVRKAVDNS